MRHLEETLKSHPQPTGFDARQRKELIVALEACAHTCRACADACLGESSVDPMRRCISTDLACAAICQTFANLLTMQTAMDRDVIKAMCHACVTACQSCAAECEKHADMHAHCKHCAQACRACVEACEQNCGAL